MRFKGKKPFLSIIVSVLIGLILAALLLTACGSPEKTTTPATTMTTSPTTTTEEIPELVVSFASTTPAPPAAMSDGYEYIMNRVTELSGGKITFEKYWNSSLLGKGELLEGIQNGVVDMAAGVAAWQAGKIPLTLVASNVIGGPKDTLTATKVMKKMYAELPELTEELAAYNIKLLYIQGSLCPDIHTTQPFETLEDLEGMKIALGGPGESAIFECIGAVPVVVPGPDRYVSLQRNVIQGQMLGVNDIADNAMYEVAKYYTYVDWTKAGALLHLWIGLDFWNNMTPAQQAIFTQAAEDGDEWFNGSYIDEAKLKSIDTMEEAGVTFYTLSDEDNQAWFDAMPNTAAAWADQMEEQGLPGWKVLEAYLRICEEEGYVWLRDWTQE